VASLDGSAGRNNFLSECRLSEWEERGLREARPVKGRAVAAAGGLGAGDDVAVWKGTHDRRQGQ
jgi:hypothetical protein